MVSVYIDKCVYQDKFDNRSGTYLNYADLYDGMIDRIDGEIVYSVFLEEQFERDERKELFLSEIKKLRKHFQVRKESVTREVEEKANLLRDKYRLQWEDSIHLAIAIVAECDYFATRDGQTKPGILQRYEGNEIEVILPERL